MVTAHLKRLPVLRVFFVVIMEAESRDKCMLLCLHEDPASMPATKQAIAYHPLKALLIRRLLWCCWHFYRHHISPIGCPLTRGFLRCCWHFLASLLFKGVPKINWLASLLALASFWWRVILQWRATFGGTLMHSIGYWEIYR